MENKVIKKAPFKRMKGVDLDSWLGNEPDNAMKEPIIIEKPDGLGMKMPPDGLTVEHVAEYIGEDVPLEVIGQSLCISPPFRSLSYCLLSRCRVPIDIPRVEPRQMGRLCGARAVEA